MFRVLKADKRKYIVYYDKVSDLYTIYNESVYQIDDFIPVVKTDNLDNAIKISKGLNLLNNEKETK